MDHVRKYSLRSEVSRAIFTDLGRIIHGRGLSRSVSYFYYPTLFALLCTYLHLFAFLCIYYAL